jgi:adenosine deaminase
LTDGFYITINSDDPPMFNTTLTNECLLGHKTWGWDRERIMGLVVNVVIASLLPKDGRGKMQFAYRMQFDY